MTELLVYLYAESPVHAGGLASDGAIDLPIQREGTTGYPVIWGQSLKGALRRAAFEAAWDAGTISRVFGSAVNERSRGVAQDADGGAAAGVLSVADAHIVAIPVPTLIRTFAWATSRIALTRLARKYATLGLDSPPVPDPPPGGATAATAAWTGPRHEHVLGSYVVPVSPLPDEELAAWAGRIARDAIGEVGPSEPFAAKLREDLLAVGADVMPALAADCTEITARVQLGPAKTVESGPFYSEYLPAETIMATSLTLRTRSRQPAQDDAARLRRLLHGSLLQIGGDETLGKGLTWTRVIGLED